MTPCPHGNVPARKRVFQHRSASRKKAPRKDVLNDSRRPAIRGADEERSFAALLTTCCLVTFACYFAVSMRLRDSGLVPLHASGFGVTTSQIGVINAAFYLMAAACWQCLPALYPICSAENAWPSAVR